MKRLRHGPLHWEAAVADFLETFESWLPLDNFNNAERIYQQWVEMFLKKCASEIREARKNSRQGNTRLAMDLGEHASKKATSKVPVLPNTTSMVVICWVSNANDIVRSPNQLQASYTDVRHCEELTDFVNKAGHPKEPYILTSKFKCSLEQDKLEEE